jgi:hypothetical protein
MSGGVLFQRKSPVVSQAGSAARVPQMARKKQAVIFMSRGMLLD